MNFTFNTRHIHNRASFPFWPSHFILSGVIYNCHPLYPSSILDTFQPRGLSSSLVSFCFFMLFVGFSRKGYWNGLPFPPLVDHVLLKLITITCPSWWPSMVWFMFSLSYASPFTTRLWSVFPMLNDISVYLIYFMHSTLYLLILYVYITLSSSLSPLVTTTLLSVS